MSLCPDNGVLVSTTLTRGDWRRQNQLVSISQVTSTQNSVFALVTAFLGAVVSIWALGCTSITQAPAAAAPGGPSTSSSVPSGAVPQTQASNAPLLLDARVQQTLGPDAGSNIDGGSETHLPISSPCVLHSGQANKRTHRSRLPDGSIGLESVGGSCSADAECIAKKGQQSVGDGFVRLQCSERACTCQLEPLTSRMEPITFTFELEAPCTTCSEAMKLIVQRCMPGMTVVSRH